MNRIVAFVDGFNLYHALQEETLPLSKYKWLNLKVLTRCFLRPQDDLKAVFYFTAYATWSAEKMARHKLYVRALELEGVQPVFGAFRNRDRLCQKCGKKFRTFEEKQTDVNIAIKLLQTAIADLYDTALIISGDSDLIPAIRAVKETFPNKKIHLVIPICRRAEELKQIVDTHMKMKIKHLQASQFSDRIEKDGLVLQRPESWR